MQRRSMPYSILQHIKHRNKTKSKVSQRKQVSIRTYTKKIMLRHLAVQSSWKHVMSTLMINFHTQTQSGKRILH